MLVDRDRAVALRARPPTDVASSVALFFRGRPLSRFRGPEGEVQVQARLAEADRTSLERLRGHADRRAARRGEVGAARARSPTSAR